MRGAHIPVLLVVPAEVVDSLAAITKAQSVSVFIMQNPRAGLTNNQ